MTRLDTQEGSVPRNLRHLRVFLAVVNSGSVTAAAKACHISQPAVTQALNKLEATIGLPLFNRSPHGIFASDTGRLLATRVGRAFGYLDPALSEVAPRLRVTATTAQLQALIAVREAENFTLAAKIMGIAQPTVHRAITQLEQEAARPLFERTSYGIVATRAAVNLAQAARLAFAELTQAEADLGEVMAAEAGRIVIGAMPLSRSYLLPKAIARFRELRPRLPIHVLDGPYKELLSGLRRGEIDFLIGALRDPPPIGDVEQRLLFHDTVVMVAGRDHPLANRQNTDMNELARYPWVVGQRGTPIRAHFDALFSQAGIDLPASIVESSSLILMRELLDTSDHLGCISYLQAQAEISRGLLQALPMDLSHTSRPIGITTRASWLPTKAQRQLLDLLEAAL
ncbi:LysR family transcriptional regulator [Rhizobium sp. ACO-34A]|nr:LysR family transcriptional regulator [Rhizobium sp. ACO-34A]ATN32806.1 LysR family transcriptional regulator [Rhizobium sp. ACO-34A]